MILVTRASGLIGSIVVGEFAPADDASEGVGQESPQSFCTRDTPWVDLVEGDMPRPEARGAALEGVEHVLMISIDRCKDSNR